MPMRDLIPWGRSRSTELSRPGGELSPFMTLHREMNRLFDDVFRGFDSPELFGRMPTWPNIEVNETDKELKVTAELPGLEEKDVEVLLENDVLTLRGEKKAETEDKERQFSERYYGRFERRIPLGYEVEPDKVQASFRNGVLSVTLPRSAKAVERAKRISINSAK